jgi:hypothetical protein
VTFESLHDLSCLHVEDVDDAVEGTAGNVLAVGAVGEAQSELPVLWVEDLLCFAALHVVHRNFAVVGSGDDVSAVRRECDGPQVDGAEGNLVQQLSVFSVPQAKRRVERAAGDV